MSRIRLSLAAATLSVLLAAGPAWAGAVVLDLRSDPLEGNPGPAVLIVTGAEPSSFIHDAATPRAFPSDAPGSLLARYDSTIGTTRAAAPLGALYTGQDDFVFGAVLTIRTHPFEPDPFGFHPIAFSLMNAATTGDDRTGDLSDFRADTFDTIDVAYFPQVSPLFGGPFLTPAVFGSAAGDDAFMDFSFGSALFEIVPGLPHLIVAEHRSAARRLVVTVYGIGPGGRPVSLPGGRVEADLSFLSGFAVDTLAVSSYEDGFNVFSSSGRSLRADVEYDVLFFAPGRLGPGGTLPPLEGILRRTAEGAAGLSGR